MRSSVDTRTAARSAAQTLPAVDDLYGQGSTLAEAKDDLVEAALDFVDAWEAELRAAPNQRHKSGHARRVQFAHDQAQVAEVLFGSTPGGPQQ